MTSEEVAIERPLPLHIKLAILVVALTPLCILLAILQFIAVPGQAIDIPGVALLAIANFIPLAALCLRYVRFERRWIAPSVVANAVILLSLAIVPTVFPVSRIVPTGMPLDMHDTADRSSMKIVPTEHQHGDRSDQGPDRVKESIDKALDKFLKDADQPRPPAAQASRPPPSAADTPPSPVPSIQTAEMPSSPQVSPPIPTVSPPGSQPASPSLPDILKPPAMAGQKSVVSKQAQLPTSPSSDLPQRPPRPLGPGAVIFADGPSPGTIAGLDPLNDLAMMRPMSSPPPTVSGQTTTDDAKGIYWNTWLDDSATAGSKSMILNRTYTLTLDLAAYDYSALRKVAAVAGVTADRKIDDALNDPEWGDVHLTVKPVIPEGGGLRLIDVNKYETKINRERLQKPDEAAKDRYKQDGKVVDLSKAISAFNFSMTVRTEATGCATIAFSIFDGYRPLDHLVLRIAIGATATSAPTCDVDDPKQQRVLSGGLDSLREINLGIEGSAPSFKADGALHIFDHETFSIVAFVDGRKPQSIFGWQTQGSVIDELRKDSFQGLIQKARDDSARKVPGSYVPAAQQLATVLFAAKDGTAEDAQKAKDAFIDLVKQTANPVIVVRMASRNVEGQNRSLYLPLGILGAQGPDAVLDKPIVVVQPMAVERYAPKNRCVGEWTFAVPSKLDQVEGEQMPPDFFPSAPPGKRLLTIDEFKPYLAQPKPGTAVGFSPAVNPSSAIGFVVLAHQDDGNLWFDERTKFIVKQHIDRRFPLGSVGIFAACSVASPKGRNNDLLQKLNERGVDTMIASPFAIDAPYGITFAASFAEVLQDATEAAADPTILDLYNRAVAKTSRKLKDNNNGDYADLGLEYVLLGNSAMRLCKPATASGVQ